MSVVEGDTVGVVAVLRSTVEVVVELTRVMGGACRFVVVSGVEPLLVVHLKLMVERCLRRCLGHCKSLGCRKSLGCHGEGGQRGYKG